VHVVVLSICTHAIANRSLLAVSEITDRNDAPHISRIAGQVYTIVLSTPICRKRGRRLWTQELMSCWAIYCLRPTCRLREKRGLYCDTFYPFGREVACGRPGARGCVVCCVRRSHVVAIRSSGTVNRRS